MMYCKKLICSVFLLQFAITAQILMLVVQDIYIGLASMVKALSKQNFKN